jgi:AraC-like DNA-binding protein
MSSFANQEYWIVNIKIIAVKITANEMDVRTIVLVIGAITIAHCGYLGIVLFSLSKKRENRILSLILVLFAIRTGKSVLSLLVPESAYGAAFVGLLAMGCLGPLLLLYIKQSYQDKNIGRFLLYIQFLPILVVLPLVVIHDWKLMTYGYYAFTLQIVVYTGYCLVLLVRRKSYYAGDDLQWDWLARLTTGYVLLSLSFVIQLLFYNPLVYLSNVMLAALIVYGLSIMALRSARLFNPKTERKPNDSSQSREVGERVQKMLEDEELFCDPDLNISKLAGVMKRPPYLVSRSVNQFFRTSFPELLLKYRLKKAEQLLLTKGNLLSIEGVAYESGFNTLSAFYSSFKKHYGMTPTQFKQRQSGNSGSMKIA